MKVVEEKVRATSVDYIITVEYKSGIYPMALCRPFSEKYFATFIFREYCMNTIYYHIFSRTHSLELRKFKKMKIYKLIVCIFETK